MAAFHKSEYVTRLEANLPADVAGKVSILGMIPRQELLDRYYSSDVFAFPPIWDEGFGLPPVEAMAAGLPVVASRSGTVKETVVEGRTGCWSRRIMPVNLRRHYCSCSKMTRVAKPWAGRAGAGCSNTLPGRGVAAGMFTRYEQLCVRRNLPAT